LFLNLNCRLLIKTLSTIEKLVFAISPVPTVLNW
jgi:hypothetical protein